MLLLHATTLLEVFVVIFMVYYFLFFLFFSRCSYTGHTVLGEKTSLGEFLAVTRDHGHLSAPGFVKKVPASLPDPPKPSRPQGKAKTLLYRTRIFIHNKFSNKSLHSLFIPSKGPIREDIFSPSTVYTDHNPKDPLNNFPLISLICFLWVHGGCLGGVSGYFEGCLGDVWGCYARILVVFWRDLGGKHGLRKFNKCMNKTILFSYFVLFE